MNTTTWIFDGQDKISAIVQKIDTVFSDAMAGVKKSTQGAIDTQNELVDKVKQIGNDIKVPNPLESLKDGTKNITELAGSGDDLKKSLIPSFAELGKLGASIGITAMATAFVGFSKSIKETAETYKSYEDALANSIGAKRAADSMMLLKNISQDIPFQFKDIADGFTSLSDEGFVSTKSEMENLGDLATKLKVDFNALAKADTAAQNGSFEQLQKMGIHAEKNGKKITMSFQGVNKEIANTPQAIHKAILSFGQMDGVKGSMAIMLDEVSGAKNKMFNHFDSLKLKIAESLSPAFDIAKNIMVKIIEKVTQVIDFIKNHWETISTVLKSFAIGLGIVAVGFAILNAQAIIASIGVGLLNIALIVSPIGIVIALITGLGYALMQCWKKFEGFRVFVYSLWGTIKSVFSSMWDVVKNFFGGLADMVSAIIDGDWSGFTEGAKKFGKGLIGATPIGFVAEYGTDIVNGAKQGAQDGKQSFKDSQKKKEEAKSPLDIINDKNKPMATLPIGKNGKDKLSNNSGSTGSQVRNVRVDIKQLIGSINISSTTVKEGLGNIKSQITEAIVSAVRDSEIAIAQ